MLYKTPNRQGARYRTMGIWWSGLVWISVVVGWPGAEVWGQELSYRLRVPSRLPGRGALTAQLDSKIRSVLMVEGFVVKPASAVRKGYHLDISVAMEESFPASEPPTCTVQLIFQIVVMPEKRLVMNASSSGKSNFNKAIPYTKQKRDHLRRLAIDKATQYFQANVRNAIHKIERRKKTLPKNMILGRKWRRTGHARWRGTMPAGPVRKGGTVRWKWLPAGVDALRQRPPFPAQPKGL